MHGFVKGFCISWMGTERIGTLGNKVVHPLVNLSNGEIVGSGEFSGSGLAFDDLHDRYGLAAGRPAFDVFGWLVHRSTPFWLQFSLGLPAPDPGKLSPA